MNKTIPYLHETDYKPARFVQTLTTTGQTVSCRTLIEFALRMHHFYTADKWERRARRRG